MHFVRPDSGARPFDIGSFFSFVYGHFFLWDLSGPANIPLGTLGVLHVPGYLAWVALLYAGAGTWLIIKIGRPLVPLNFR
jgi:ABC-type uncharacterized transport system fused permease/ATPase subunit